MNHYVVVFIVCFILLVVGAVWPNQWLHVETFTDSRKGAVTGKPLVRTITRTLAKRAPPQPGAHPDEWIRKSEMLPCVCPELSCPKHNPEDYGAPGADLNAELNGGVSYSSKYDYLYTLPNGYLHDVQVAENSQTPNDVPGYFPNYGAR